MKEHFVDKVNTLLSKDLPLVNNRKMELCLFFNVPKPGTWSIRKAPPPVRVTCQNNLILLQVSAKTFEASPLDQPLTTCR